jgi:hypothetical protein
MSKSCIPRSNSLIDHHTAILSRPSLLAPVPVGSSGPSGGEVHGHRGILNPTPPGSSRIHATLCTAIHHVSTAIGFVWLRFRAAQSGLGDLTCKVAMV